MYTLMGEAAEGAEQKIVLINKGLLPGRPLVRGLHR